MHARIYYITRAVERLERRRRKRNEREMKTRDQTWQSVCGREDQDIKKMLGHTYVVFWMIVGCWYTTTCIHVCTEILYVHCVGKKNELSHSKWYVWRLYKKWQKQRLSVQWDRGLASFLFFPFFLFSFSFSWPPPLQLVIHQCQQTLEALTMT